MATKKALAQPSYGDWHLLSKITERLNLLIDDAEGKVLDTPLGKLTTEKPKGLSKFAARQFGLLNAPDEDVLKSDLPEAASLGQSRDERLQKLRELCMRLKAFKWLQNQNGFQAALKTMRKVGKQYSIESYAADTLDFQLIRSIAQPAGWYTEATRIGYVRKYPGREDLRELSRNAESITRALERWQFSPQIEVSPFLYKALASLKKELDEKAVGWTKPHDDAGLTEAKFQYQMIENCFVTFGRCSPTVVQHIIGMFGISIDNTKLRARVKEVESSRAKNPKNGHFFT
jgi:hypothetical protein